MNPTMKPALAETLERIRTTARMSQTDWCDLLNIHWSDYLKFKSGQLSLLDNSLETLAENFDLSLDDLKTGQLNFVEFGIQIQPKDMALPERYMKAAHGRRRSSISSVDYLEDVMGWRLRTDVVQKFNIPESELLNPFEPISVLFMTDLCAYLARRGFQKNHFMEMGAYGFKSTSKSLIGKHFSSLKNPGEIYDSFFNEIMKFFEENCTYVLTSLTETGGTFEVHSNSDVAHELGVRHIGNLPLCDFKAGLAASMPMYLGLPMAEVRQTACVHDGDSCCRYEFTYRPQNAS